MTTRARLLGLAVAAAFAVAGVAGVAQQVIRQPANHPQAEMAQSAASRLNAGETPQAVIPARSVDIGQSTAPFVIVLDSSRSVLASSATLDGQVALPPPGVFDYVTSHGEDRVTWQPTANVRSWIVVDAFHGGYVVAGRSPAQGEADGYLVIFWGSLAALGLAVVAVAGAIAVKVQ
ncbi:MAG TPA: hypothetical protein VFL29_11015 [Candidatus Dormibacteraeota bacterium]|nr:hypothetical protein [Candidatus Dormibacteraeota bacterium]